MRTPRAIPILAALACCASPPAPRPIGNTGSAPPQATASDELASMILSGVVANPSSVPDSELLGESGSIPVVIDVTNGAMPSVARMPHGARPFVFTTVAELQQQADAKRAKIGYLHISITIDSPTSAQVEHGGDFVAPADPKAVKMCCCSTSRRYDKTSTGWRVHGNVVISSCS
ncbi:MAG TPA: hypothetical protein VMJ10_23560 [Kofleriaceae bacterium]|nr:hypothetical protein [Kofleriaceae bacterium]